MSENNDQNDGSGPPIRAVRLQRAIETRGPMEDTIFPIPLRAGSVIVRIQGLPHDLTAAEAAKIVAIIMAYAQEGAE